MPSFSLSWRLVWPTHLVMWMDQNKTALRKCFLVIATELVRERKCWRNLKCHFSLVYIKWERHDTGMITCIFVAVSTHSVFLKFFPCSCWESTRAFRKTSVLEDWGFRLRKRNFAKLEFLLLWNRGSHGKWIMIFLKKRLIYLKGRITEEERGTFHILVRSPDGHNRD